MYLWYRKIIKEDLKEFSQFSNDTMFLDKYGWTYTLQTLVKQFYAVFNFDLHILEDILESSVTLDKF